MYKSCMQCSHDTEHRYISERVQKFSVNPVLYPTRRNSRKKQSNTAHSEHQSSTRGHVEGSKPHRHCPSRIMPMLEPHSSVTVLEAVQDIVG